MGDLQRGLQVIENIIRRHFRLTAADADKSDIIGHLRKSAARIEALEAMLRECVDAAENMVAVADGEGGTKPNAREWFHTTLTRAKEMLK